MRPRTSAATRTRRTALRSALHAALALGCAAAAAAEERWFVFSIADAPVGYATEITRTEGTSRLTETSLAATLNRLGSTVEMRFATAYRESTAGELEWLRSDVQLSQQAMRLEAFVEADRIRVLSASGPDAAAHERDVERGGSRLLGPAAIRSLTDRELRRVGDEVELATFSPELQRVTTVRRVVAATGEQPPCAPDGPPARRIEETVDGMPGARTLWIDERGEVIQDSIGGPFGPMTTCRASEEAALAAAGGGSLPAEIYARTIVRSNVRLPDPLGVDRLLVRLRPRDSQRPLPDLAAENQTVTRRGDALEVEIRRPSPPAATDGAGAAAAAPAAEYLQPNALIESDHPEIAALARTVAGDETDPWRAALRLTEWVAENLSLDLGVVMAPASELVRDRRATCVGYATLLATLARARGIPSRVAMGMVYYGGIFGGHAWTEVWADGRWLPLDAAVYAPGVASAARFAVDESSFQDGGGDLMVELGELYGNVDVEVLEADWAGRTARVPAGPAYEVAGSVYRNHGLELAIDATGWQIEEADSVWPSTLVVAFRRGEERVELHELPRAPATRSLAALSAALAGGEAVFVAPRGGTLWLYRAAGPRPEESLRQLVDGVRAAP